MMDLKKPVDFYAMLDELHPDQNPTSTFPQIYTIQPPKEALTISEDDWGIYDYHGTPLYTMWNGHFSYDVQYHDGKQWQPVNITGFF